MRNRDEAKEILILETALKLIAKIGLSGLKMSSLARETGLATGTLYIYFKDKEELIRKLYLHLLRKTTDDYTNGIPENQPVKLKAKALIYNYLKDSILHPEHGAFFEQYFRSPYFVETENVRLEEENVMQPIYEMVVQGQEEAIIKTVNPELLVTLVCGMINEVAKEAIYTQKQLDDIDWETIFGVIWDGIKS